MIRELWFSVANGEFPVPTRDNVRCGCEAVAVSPARLWIL